MIDNGILQPVHTEPAYRLAAKTIRDRILNGDIQVGEALPSELALADLLHVNRSTVRESIRLLEENGIVARKPGGKKLFVSLPKGAELSSRMTAAMILHKIKVEELYRTMRVLEPSIAADAARFVTEDQLTRLAENLEKTEASLNDSSTVALLDIEFHDLLAEACGNRAMQLCRQPIGELFYPVFEAVMQRMNAGERLLAAHRSIFLAIQEGDATTAEEWMIKHIVDFQRGYELANLDIDTPITRLPKLEGATNE